MQKPKQQSSGGKHTDNRSKISRSGKDARSGSGSSDSGGGSRQGNAGHESSPQGGKGDRQG